MTIQRRHVIGAVLAATLARAGAQEPWKPSRPIRLVVPFPPGGGADVIARLTSRGVAARLGQSVVVDNKGGASGAIGSEIAYRAPADGQTLLLATVDSQVINPQITKVPFDSSRFTPLAAIAEAPYVLVGRGDLPAANIAELMALMKTTRLSYASAGHGTVTHVLGIALSRECKSELIHVPFQGSGPAAQAVLAGTVDLCWISPSFANQQRARLRLFATPSRQRLDVLKDVPTMGELGLAVTGASWLAWMAPPNMPEPIAAVVAAAVLETVASNEVANKVREIGMVPLSMSHDEFAKFYQDEYRKWGDVVRTAHVKVE